MLPLAWLVVVVAISAGHAAPTRTSPIAVAPNDVVFVVNPDSSSVARLDLSGPHGVLTHEAPVGAHPRTVTLAGPYVFTANQRGDDVTRCDQLAPTAATCRSKALGPGCNPYGITATPAGDAVVVSCQGSSELVLMTTALEVTARIALDWPNARAIAVASDGSRAYVTHFLTAEPGTEARVSVVDLRAASVATVFAIAADAATCETQNSGQGVLNQLSAIALVPDGAPADVAGQLWVGGTQQNNVAKGLFKREPDAFCRGQRRRARRCVPKAGTDLFPLPTFTPFPRGGLARNKYQPSAHDVVRFGIVKLDAADGRRVGKIDVDQAGMASDIEFSADGTTAFVVDQTFNSYHLFNTKKGQGGDVTTLFAAPSAFGPGGAQPSAPCVPGALPPVTSEAPFRLAPQAQLVTIDGTEPLDRDGAVVATGLDFDTADYVATGVSRMRAVPDGIGTAPIGVRVAPSGDRAYVLNYLARNVVTVATASALPGEPGSLRCSGSPQTTCTTDADCASSPGFCNDRGGLACTTDADCATAGPCVRSSHCVPLVLDGPVSSITGRCTGPGETGVLCTRDGDCASGTCSGIAGDPLPAAVLDGKILFGTAARDASVTNDLGLARGAPLFNEPDVTCAGGPNVGGTCRHQADCGDASLGLCRVGRSAPGAVVSIAHDGSYVSCTSCHADLGGQDGRTWDFAQFGVSLRNTMDLRGRAGFSPGTCGAGPRQGASCTVDAVCGDGYRCVADPATVPPHVLPADRHRWFNPMQTAHWDGDRDEVEDFEQTLRSLQGAGDCDGLEHLRSCVGALVQRDVAMTSERPRVNSAGQHDVEPALAAPNRHLPGEAGGEVGVRLTHLADFVYSLTTFAANPNRPSEASERGRALFVDPVVGCAGCHDGGRGGQFFSDKAPATAFDPARPARGDENNPFVRHDVGTANVFDETDPYEVALAQQLFQNAAVPIPAPRGPLRQYVTPVLVDVWDTAPYLHDGSAPTLLDVVRPCESTREPCARLGAGRNIHDRGRGRHGTTALLTPRQLNELVAFLASLTTSTDLGPRGPAVDARALRLRTARLRFDGLRSGAFKITGHLPAASRPVPLHDVRLELGTPDDGAMAVVERRLAMEPRGTRLIGTTTEAEGEVSLVLRARRDGSYRFVVRGRNLDLGVLDTGHRDLTVALIAADTQFVGRRKIRRR